MLRTGDWCLLDGKLPALEVLGGGAECCHGRDLLLVMDQGGKREWYHPERLTALPLPNAFDAVIGYGHETMTATGTGGESDA